MNDMDISFRLLTEAELDIASDILVSAYHFTGNRSAMLYDYLAVQPDGWWLVLADGVPVGYGGAVDYGAFSYVGMLSVYPSLQNKGIGEALTRRIMQWGEERACPTLFLDAVERAAKLYARLGFIDEDTTHLFHREASSPLLFQPSSDVAIAILQPENIPEVVAFDALSFGAEREKIFTSPMVFTPERAFVTRNDIGQLTGYLFVQSGFLGPWVASNIADAEKLLQQALSLPLERGATACIPGANEEGCALLKRYGFSVKSTDHHMRSGKIALRRRAMIYGQTSPALG